MKYRLLEEGDLIHENCEYLIMAENRWVKISKTANGLGKPWNQKEYAFMREPI